jgi:hypothetical protein
MNVIAVTILDLNLRSTPAGSVAIISYPMKPSSEQRRQGKTCVGDELLRGYELEFRLKLR